MNYSITDGQYLCAECPKISATLLAHNSHYRKHKNAAAKAAITEAPPQRTVRTVAQSAPVVATVQPPQQPAPRKSWFENLLWGSD